MPAYGASHGVMVKNMSKIMCQKRSVRPELFPLLMTENSARCSWVSQAKRFKKRNLRASVVVDADNFKTSKWLGGSSVVRIFGLKLARTNALQRCYIQDTRSDFCPPDRQPTADGLRIRLVGRAELPTGWLLIP